MADYFVSDVHLRLDRPERGERLAGLVDRLDPSDRLFIVGDLCDFWFASRQSRADPTRCPGLNSLLAFRARGGAVRLLLGNHDNWLQGYYRERLGVEVEEQPLRVESYGRRLHLAHGHKIRESSTLWKSALEARAFLTAFRLLPTWLATRLEARLDRVNLRKQAESDRRLIVAYREHARTLAGSADLVVFGHVHRPHRDDSIDPALIVLGDWIKRSCFLRIDAEGVQHQVEPLPVPA